MDLKPRLPVLEVCISLIVTTVLFSGTEAFSGGQRAARAGGSYSYSSSQGRQYRYYYAIISRNYYYYNEKYSTLLRSTLGFARYNRVYASTGGHTNKYYSQYFSFTRRLAFKTFKNGIHKEISVCRNFEANENGTYLGIFTCPLPFEPEHYAYCCGVSNAEYCCRFEDSAVNIIGAVAISLFVICPLVFSLYALQRWCRKEARLQREIRRRWRIAIEKVMDKERTEACKMAFVNSLALEETDADSSLATGSLPSLPSICSSTTSVRERDARRFLRDDTGSHFQTGNNGVDTEREEASIISSEYTTKANSDYESVMGTEREETATVSSCEYTTTNCDHERSVNIAREDTLVTPSEEYSDADDSSVNTDSLPSLPSIWSSASSVRVINDS